MKFLWGMAFGIPLIALANATAPIWVGNGQDLVPIDPISTITKQPVSISPVADLAADQTGALWALSGTALIRVAPDTSQTQTWTLLQLGIPGALQVRTNPYNNSAWLSDGHTIVNINDLGANIAVVTVPVVVTDFVVALDESLWLLCGTEIYHYTPTGKPLEHFSISSTGKPIATRLEIDSLNHLIWLKGQSRIDQLDASTHAMRATIALPANFRASALDPITDTLWLLTPDSLIGHAIDGTVEQINLNAYGISDAKALVYESVTNSLWIADPTGVNRLHIQTRDMARVPLASATRLVVPAPLVVMPSIKSLSTFSVNLPITLSLDALCSGNSCKVPKSYFRDFQIRETVGGRPISSAFSIDPDAQRATQQNVVKPFSSNAGNLSVQATDSFGHLSNAITASSGPGSASNPASAAAATAATSKAAAVTPVVSITSPSANATFVGPTNITITATASSTGRTISKVQFFRGTTSLGTDTSSPYSFAWTNAAAGTYSLTAKVTDSANATATSAAVNITITANAPPVVSITSPTTGSGFNSPATIALKANATDTNATISKVEFYKGSTLLGTSTTAPYAYNWTSVANGSYSLTAKATNSFGTTTTSSAVAVTVVSPASVSITSPANNASYASAPASIPITATATETGATISKVEFLSGAMVLGMDATSPYTFSWTGVPAGTYSLTARATNNFGVAVSSNPITVTVRAPPVVAITLPSAGANYSAPAAIQIDANASEAGGSITKVDFYRGSTLVGTATSAPYSIIWSGVPAGNYSITAKATDARGISTTSAAVPITVTAPHFPPTVSIVTPTSTDVFTEPAVVTLTANASEVNGTVTSVDYYRNSTYFGTSNAPPWDFQWVNMPQGTYTITAVATDAEFDSATSDPVTITVRPPPPAVALTSPTAGMTYDTSSSSGINFSVNVTGGAGGVVNVQYAVKNRAGVESVIGTVTAPPYNFTWNNPTSGAYSVIAYATDTLGGVGKSSYVPIVVETADTCTLQTSAVDVTNSQLAFGTIPRTFEPNQGQAAAGVQFISRRGSELISLKAGSIELSRARNSSSGSSESSTSLAIELKGANTKAEAVGINKVAEVSNYLTGQDQSKWHVGVPHFSTVQFKDVYPGIDQVIYDNGKNLEYDLTLSPDADPRQIKLFASGAKALKINRAGELVLQTSSGAVVQQIPTAYQVFGNKRVQVAASYRLDKNGIVGIKLGAYNHDLPLVIDPIIVYAGFFPSATISGMAIDHCGEAVLVGTAGAGYPSTANAYAQASGSSQSLGFVTKLNSAGTALVYSTFLGVDAASSINGVTVDSNGRAYVVGVTYSSHFPVTAGAMDTSKSPSYSSPQGFAAKLSSDGSMLLYSTFLGGTSTQSGLTYADTPTAIAIDSSGNAFITGYAYSDNFPVTAGAYQSHKATLNAPTMANSFVMKLNPTGSGLLYSTYVGGSGTHQDAAHRIGDYANAIAIDSVGNAYVGGETTNSTFPHTSGAYSGTYVGANWSGSSGQYSNDTFLYKLNASGSTLAFSTYVNSNTLKGVAIDAANNVYVTGDGVAPSAVRPYLHEITSHPAFNNTSDAYVLKFIPDGSALAYATYWGGVTCPNGNCTYTQNMGRGIAVDQDGNAVVAGYTNNPDFPVVRTIQTYVNLTDGFVTKLNAAGTALTYSTLIAGSAQTYNMITNVTAFATGNDGAVYLAGTTSNPSLPVTPGAYQSSPGTGTPYSYIQKISDLRDTVTSLTSDKSGILTTQAVTLTATVAGHSPTGTVTFFDGLTTLGSAPLVNGSAVLTVTTLADGERSLTATYNSDVSNNGSTSPAAKVTVSDPFAKPSVRITSPSDGTLVSNPGGSVTSYISLQADAAAGNNIVSFDMFQDDGDMGTRILSSPSSSYSYTYTGASYSSGTHIYYAVATDNLGNKGTSSPIRITVNSPAGTPPTVTMTSPANGTTIPANGQVTVSANATPAAGAGIQFLQFYQNGSNIGQVTGAATGSVIASNLQPGNYAFSVTAIDTNGVSGNSPLANVTVTPAANPNVYLSSPTNNATYYSPAALSIQAAAAATGTATIAKVEFYANGTLIGTSTSAPYGVSWTGISVGTYAISAVVTDSNGLTATSATRNITYASPNPVVSITAPSNRSTYSAPATVAFTASASAVNGATLTKVDFYQGTTLLGTVASAPYTATWNGIPSGSYTITAVATDNNGRTTTSSPLYIGVKGTVAGVPGISIISPTNYSSVTVPSQVLVTASAYAGSSSVVSKVEFFQGTTLLGTATALPYNFPWNIVSSGAHSIWAKVTDSSGATAKTDALTINGVSNTALSLQLASGISGATVGTDQILIHGSVQAPINSSVILSDASSGIPISVGTISDNGEFFFNNIQLQSGANSFNVVLEDSDGNLISTGLNVNSTASAPFTFTSSASEAMSLGLGAVQINLTWQDLGVLSYTEADVSCDGTGSKDFVLTTPVDGPFGACLYSSPGIHRPTLTVMKRLSDGTLQVIFTQQLMINIYTFSQLDNKLQSVIAMALGRLRQGNISSAMNLFSQESVKTFSTAFTNLSSNLAPFILSLSAPESPDLSADLSTYILERTTPDGPDGGPIVLIRGQDNIWRISRM